MSENCIFCKIIKKEVPAEIVFEDSNLMAFLDIAPVNYGHLLLIPKKHFPLMVDVPDALLSKITIKTKFLMKKLKEAMKADFVVVSVVGLDVPHFHVHIIPRYRDDGLKNFWPTKKYQNDDIKQIADKIRKQIKSSPFVNNSKGGR